MIVFSEGMVSPHPVMPCDAGQLRLVGEGHDVLAICVVQCTNITEQELPAFRYSNIRISLTTIREGDDVMPVFTFKWGSLRFECPFSLGALASASRSVLREALQSAGSLTHEQTWPMQFHLVNADTNTLDVFRMTTLSPRFWRMAAGAILRTEDIDLVSQAAMMSRAIVKFPTPKALEKHARIREVVGKAR